MKRERRRCDPEAKRTINCTEPLDDEIDVKFQLGRSLLLVDLSQAETVNVAVVPGEFVEVSSGPLLRHGVPDAFRTQDGLSTPYLVPPIVLAGYLGQDNIYLILEHWFKI